MSKARQLADNGAATPNKNILINGATNISQRGTSFTGLGSSNAVTFGADRFYVYTANTAGRVTMEPLTADGPSGFANSVKLSCTTADTSIAANELVLFSQGIEGRNLQRTDKGSSTAKKLTASFYVKGNAAATYMFILYDTDNNRISTTQFGVTTSWNRIEVAIPADTTGAFNDDNNLSAYFQFYLHAGSNYTSGTYTAGSWQTNTNANFAPGISSFVDATSRTLFITGCQLEVSDAATPFEHKNYGQDLIDCQRYYTQETAASGSAYKRYGFGGWNTSTAGEIFIPLSTPMRDSPPTLVSKAAASYQAYSANATDALTAIAINAETNNGTNNRIVGLTFSTSSGGVAGEAVQVTATNDTASYLALDAEIS